MIEFKRTLHKGRGETGYHQIVWKGRETSTPGLVICHPVVPRITKRPIPGIQDAEVEYTEGKGWQVIHKPSGFIVIGLSNPLGTIKEAKEAAEGLGGFCDWEQGYDDIQRDWGLADAEEWVRKHYG